MHLDGYQNGLASIVNKFFWQNKKRTWDNENDLKGVQNKPVPNELPKQIIRKSVRKYFQYQ